MATLKQQTASHGHGSQTPPRTPSSVAHRRAQDQLQARGDYKKRSTRIVVRGRVSAGTLHAWEHYSCLRRHYTAAYTRFMKHLLWRRFAHTGERQQLQPPGPRSNVAFYSQTWIALKTAGQLRPFAAAMTSLMARRWWSRSRIGSISCRTRLRKFNFDHSGVASFLIYWLKMSRERYFPLFSFSL